MTDFDAPASACHLCGSDRSTYFYGDFNLRTIFICNDCGVQFLNPQYSETYLADFYAHYTVLERPDADERLLNYWRCMFSLLERRGVSKGKYLDIGCGGGHSLQVAKETGWQPTGYEIDAELARKVEAKTGVRVLTGDFVSMDRGQAYDLISMNHVIEHLKQPRSYICTLHSLLNENGILYLALPNIRSFSSSGKYLLEKLGLRTKNIGRYYDSGHHMFYFTPATIQRFLEQNGFEVLDRRNCDTGNPAQPFLWKMLNRNLFNRLLLKSTFYVIARKRA